MKYLKIFEEFDEKFDSNIINNKMNGLKLLIDELSDGQNIIYEWENKNDHQILVNFTTNKFSIRYEFDVDDLFVVKFLNDKEMFKEYIDTVEEGLDIIKNDINSVLEF